MRVDKQVGIMLGRRGADGGADGGRGEGGGVNSGHFQAPNFSKQINDANVSNPRVVLDLTPGGICTSAPLDIGWAG